MPNMADALENLLTDYYFRGQVPTLPSSLHFGLLTAAASDAGTALSEVTGGGYARVAIARSLANFAGTQGAGTTTASTGSSAGTSNNIVITFPAPTANWGSIGHWGIWDAATGGALHWYAPLNQAKTVNAGDAAPQFQDGQMGVKWDDA